jgi:hypothetical protein
VLLCKLEALGSNPSLSPPPKKKKKFKLCHTLIGSGFLRRFCSFGYEKYYV